jgi:hypothetical protein
MADELASAQAQDESEDEVSEDRALEPAHARAAGVVLADWSCTTWSRSAP